MLYPRLVHRLRGATIYGNATRKKSLRS
jgi:hypothetical protein